MKKRIRLTESKINRNAKYSMYVSVKGYWYSKQGMMKVDNFGVFKRLL